jgi:hypothetical protein
MRKRIERKLRRKQFVQEIEQKLSVARFGVVLTKGLLKTTEDTDLWLVDPSRSEIRRAAGGFSEVGFLEKAFGDNRPLGVIDVEFPFVAPPPVFSQNELVIYYARLVVGILQWAWDERNSGLSYKGLLIKELEANMYWREAGGFWQTPIPPAPELIQDSAFSQRAFILAIRKLMLTGGVVKTKLGFFWLREHFEMKMGGEGIDYKSMIINHPKMRI